MRGPWGFRFPDEYAARVQANLDQALSEVPFYHKWKKYDPGRALGIFERFAALPALTKADMRASFPAGLIRRGYDLAQGLAADEVEFAFTSGTTGEKVINLWSQEWWRRSEKASWALNPALAALAYPASQATLASSLNVGIHCEEDLPYDHRIMGRVLYLNEKLNVIAWQDRHYARMADELERFRPAVIEANPSLLARLAFWARGKGMKLYDPQAIVLTYELPSLIQRRLFAEMFKAPVISSYGTTETGFVLEEGADGRMYQNLTEAHIDFVPAKQGGSPGLGRIYVSNFDNPWSTIIRFDTGDFVRLADPAQLGDRETGLCFDRIEGRIAYSTFDCSGALVTPYRFDAAIAGLREARDYHLRQLDRDHFELSLVAGTDVSADAEEIMREVYGRSGHYRIKIVKDLLPGPAGKYRRMETKLEINEKELFG